MFIASISNNYSHSLNINRTQQNRFSFTNALQNDTFMRSNQALSFKGNDSERESLADSLRKTFATRDEAKISKTLYYLAELPYLFFAQENLAAHEDLQALLEKEAKEGPYSNETKVRMAVVLNQSRDYAKSLKPKASAVDETKKSINISSTGDYPSCVLSNFYREDEPFYIDGVPCHSMEGFLQALKTQNIDEQRSLCLLSGIQAKSSGKKNNSWQETQTLYWNGVKYDRDSEEYAKLINRAYLSRFNQSETFRNALLATKGYKLRHDSGYNDPTKTILTTKEFLQNINMLRNRLFEGDAN